MVNIEKYKSMYFSECHDHFQAINNLLIEIENSPSADSIRNLLREAHSLKGMSATMGYETLARIFHEMENILNDVKESKKQYGTEENKFLFFGFQLTQKLIDKMEEGEEIHAEETEEFFKYLDSMKDSVNKVVDGKPHEWKISFKLDKNTSLPSARAFVIFKEMLSYGTILDSDPSMEDIKNGNIANDFVVHFESILSSTEIVKKLSSLTDITDVAVNTYLKPTPVSTVDLVSRREHTNVRIETSVLDKLFNLASELVIHESKLKENCKKFADRNILSDFAKVESFILSVYSIVGDMRMFPFDYILNRFPMAIRNLALERNKKVKFIVSGGEIKLERTILEELVDPLMHIFRNAIDHGIEEKDIRASLGKPEEGALEISVSRERETVSVTILDDGKGVDLNKVKDKAVEQGLYTKQKVETLSEAELLDIITTPGFSTASEVSMISGRGVGLDVVKSKIISLGGKMFIESKQDKGIKIQIELPMTVSIIKALLVSVCSQTFAIPASWVYLVVEVKHDHIYHTATQRMFDCGGDLITLVDLGSILNLSCKTEDEAIELPKKDSDNDYHSVVVVDMRGERVGIIVHHILGQKEVVVKSLGKPLEKLSFFSGVTIMGDGGTVLILDVGSLLDFKKLRSTEA